MDIIEKMDIKETSKVSYRNKLKNSDTLGLNFKDSEELINQKIYLLDDKPNNVLGYLNLMIVLRRESKMEIENLKNYRKIKIQSHTKIYLCRCHVYLYSNCNNYRLDTDIS